jgi:hypothetical protein
LGPGGGESMARLALLHGSLQNLGLIILPLREDRSLQGFEEGSCSVLIKRKINFVL